MGARSTVETPRAAPLGGVQRAMLSPALDLLLVGGASIVLFAAWALLDLDLTSQNTLERFLFVNFMINAPHFMASYKLLYGAADKRRDYPAVAWLTPAVLVVWALVGLARYGENRVFLEALFGASVVSLSWHYTGQAWGMMASFAYVLGRPFSTLERRLLRANLYTLTTFHIVWAVVVVRRIFEPRSSEAGLPLLSATQGHGLYQAVAAGALASAALGLTGLALYTRRGARLPPARVLVPWVAVHLWYVLLYFEPAALFWVQNAHALQYLVFPMRVEINRLGLGGRALDATGRAWRMGWWYVWVTVVGLLVLGLLPWLVRHPGARLGLTDFPVELTIVSIVNLHHYFIDGVIWKIRNPTVRRDLFAHLAPAA